MRTSKSKYIIYAENNPMKNSELEIINQKAIKKKELSINKEINLTENIDNKKEQKFIQKYKINYLQNPFSQENGIKKSLNKIIYDPNIKVNKPRIPSQKLIRNINNDFINFELNGKNQKVINIQNLNSNNCYHVKFNTNKNEELFPLINAITLPNIDNSNYLINNNKNNLSSQQNEKIDMNYFKNKFKRVRLGDLKKIKKHENSNNNPSVINSERLDKKTYRFFNSVKEDKIPIIVKSDEKEKDKNKEKEKEIMHKKIENIDDNDDSFIEELTDLLINVDNNGKIQINKEINKKIIIEEKKELIEEKNEDNINEIEDILNKKFEIYEDDEEEKNEEKKEDEIKIPKIRQNNYLQRPITSYGGINDREKSIKNSIRRQIQSKKF